MFIKKSKHKLNNNSKIDELTFPIPFSHQFKNPHHHEPYHVPFIMHQLKNHKSIYITPKADGIKKQIQYENMIFEVEKDESTSPITFKYIDLARSSFINPNFETRIKSIENVFKIKMMYEIDLKNINSLKDYMNKDVNINNLIFKPIIKITAECLDIENMCELYSYLSINPNTSYPNDGWIVYFESYLQPLKFKQIDFLTVDLIGDDDKIYKCLPYLENGKIKTKILTERLDKVKPNRNDIVQLIHNRLINEAKYKTMIIDYIRNPYSIYYEHDVNVETISKDIKDLLTLQRQNIYNILNSIDMNGLNVIDLGCGNGNIGKYLIENRNVITYYGIDADPIILSNNLIRNINHINMWGDINSDFDYKSLIESRSIDVILMINSVHYMKTYDLLSISETKRKVTLIIVSMFSDTIDEVLVNKILTYGDNFSIEKINDKYRFTYPWKKVSFIEKIKSSEEVIGSLQINGWRLQQIKSHFVQSHSVQSHSVQSQLNQSAQQYTEFMKMHRVLILSNFI